MEEIEENRRLNEARSANWAQKSAQFLASTNISPNQISAIPRSIIFAAIFSLALAGCGGGSGAASAGSTAPTGNSSGTSGYTVGGTISGLTGSVVLQNNGGSNLTVSANGNFNFTPQLSTGSPYQVTVLTQPTGQTCSVTGGVGTVAGNVTNVTVTCTTNLPNSTYSVGGSVTGLAGSLVLQDNSGDNLTISAAGNFTFATKIVNGNTYNVTILTQPSGQTCNVNTGVGTISGNNVTNVAVVCSTNAYRVWGVSYGLTGSVVLQNNNGDNLTLTSSGSFNFPTPLADGSPYNITVLSQPTGQSCSVINGTGTINGFNVTDLNITCLSYSYTVGGTVAGLSGSMVLQDNGGDNLTVSTNGPFTFASTVVSGNPYNVTVFTQPSGQTCTITGGIGTVTANVTNVAVNCGTTVLMGGSVQKALNLVGTVSTFAGSSTGVAGLINGTGTAAKFLNPRGITTDGTNLYVTDEGNNQIRQIAIATGAVTLLAGSPTGATGSANGIGAAALFDKPVGITTDGTNLYVADMGNNEIRKIVIATGEVTLFAGSPTGAIGSTNGTGTAALFDNPAGITTDGNNLYVTDLFNNQVRQIVIATAAVTLLAGSPTGAPGLTNGTGAAALFNSPCGITTDGTILYVTDENNNQIRKIVIATGDVSLFVGSATRTSGLTNGIGTAAQFNVPLDITTDGTYLYVSDYMNNEVRKIVIATGVVSLLAGSATGVAGLSNGTGTMARFYIPAGLTSDGTNLFVTDYLNNEIRKIQ